MIVCFLLFTVVFVGFLTAMPKENAVPAEQNFDEGRKTFFLNTYHSLFLKKETQKLEYTSSSILDRNHEKKNKGLRG